MKRMVLLCSLTAFCALAHTGEATTSYYRSFTNHYNLVGTRINNCLVCHDEQPGENAPSSNPYGVAFDALPHGSTQIIAAFLTLDPQDSDGDSYANLAEIQARTFPGDANDHPTTTTTSSSTTTTSSSTTTTPPTTTTTIPTTTTTVPPTTTTSSSTTTLSSSTTTTPPTTTTTIPTTTTTTTTVPFTTTSSSTTTVPTTTTSVSSTTTTIPPSANLVGSWAKSPKGDCKDSDEEVVCSGKGKFVVRNTGAGASLSTTVRFYLSEGCVRQPGDLQLGETIVLDPIKPGKSGKAKLKVTLPVGLEPVGMYLLAIIGPDEDNNVVCYGPFETDDHD